MASLFKQGDLYYGQFYSQRRTPERRRVPLKTTRKDEARRRLAKLTRGRRRPQRFTVEHGSEGAEPRSEPAPAAQPRLF